MMVSDTSDCLYYTIYRDSNCTNEAVCKEVIEEIKDHVWDSDGMTLKTSDGYSGFYSQHGTSRVLQTPMDLWKVIHVLFRLSEKFEGLVFSISTDDDKRNPFYIECERNEVIPKWASIPGQFTKNVYGCGGVLHCIAPEIQKTYPKMKGVEIVRKHGRLTRNILITEAVQQRVNLARQKRFGMNRVGVSVPDNLAYLARQRPDLLSQAIRLFADDERDESLDSLLESLEKVMAHAEISDRDYKVVTALADIDAPSDIVSHRIGLVLLALDRKYSNCQNGADHPDDQIYRNVEDSFERDRLASLAMILSGKKLSLAHQYQSAKALITDAHRQICRNIFRESAESSTDTRDTACSGDDEDQLPNDRNKNRKKVYKKQRDRQEVGKKRALAPVQMKKFVPEPPREYELDFDTPAASSSQFRNFERAANGDDAFYRGSSDERSLGEEEELEFFAARSKNQKPNGEIEKLATPRPHLPTIESDDGFDVSELLNAAPPLAANDEDFDDI